MEQVAMGTENIIKLGRRLLRGAVLLWGLFILTAVAGDFLAPEMIHDDGMPSSARWWATNAWLTLYGLLLVLPNRWTPRGGPYRARMFAMALGVVWFAMLLVSGVLGFVAGRKSSLILPAAVALLSLAIGAVVSLSFQSKSLET